MSHYTVRKCVMFICGGKITNINLSLWQSMFWHIFLENDMGRRGNPKSWLTGSKKQEAWATEYLLKKKVDFKNNLASSASRKPPLAVDYLKELDASISDNWILLQQASSAWRAQKSREINKQISISVSQETYDLLVSLGKANKFSIKKMAETLIINSNDAIEELERLKKLQSDYAQICKKLTEQEELIEEQDIELSAQKKRIEELEKLNDNLAKKTDEQHETRKGSDLKFHPSIQNMIEEQKQKP